MKYVLQLPPEGERKKKAKSLAAKRRTVTAFCFVFAILGIAFIVGTLITVLMAELGSFGEKTKILLYILSGSFILAAVGVALLAVLFARLSQSATLVELDFLERCDSENSFFVGEGTFATFGGGEVTLHDKENKKIIRVPYGEIRFFSVCTRYAPKEKGEWSVVLEVPAHYISKSKEKNAQPALIQTDAKERLYEVLKKEGLELLGELPAENAVKTKFNPVKKFTLPDKRKRIYSLAFIIAGVVLLAACVPVGIWWQATAGSILGVLGAFILVRAIFAFRKSKSVLAIYNEGLYWNERGEKSNSVFLKWGEIEKVERERKGEGYILTVHCAYGNYHFPDFEGAFEAVNAQKDIAK